MNEKTPKPPTREEIAARAYQLYEKRHHEHGADHADWVQAEHELNEEYQRALRATSAPDPKAAWKLPEQKRPEERRIEEKRPEDKSKAHTA